MEKIRNYVDRFLKSREINHYFALRTTEVIAFMQEMSDANRLFYSICTLFRYGYAKGYRAAMAEMKKAGAVHD